jgi:tetratricopeptide (TPR) repeat protein
MKQRKSKGTVKPDPEIRFAEAMSHHGAGRAAEAEAAYREVLALRPDHPGAMHMMGYMALQVGKFPVAVQLLTEAARLAPGNPACVANLSTALRHLGRMEEALKAGCRAVEISADFIPGLQNLSSLLDDLGRYGAAATIQRRLVALQPQQSNLRLQLARQLILADEAEAAVEVLYDLLGMVPLSVPAYTNLGAALRRLGRLEQSLAAYRTALGFAPGNTGLLNNLGILLQELDRPDEALVCFHQAIAAQPESATAYLNHSIAAREDMRLGAAITTARMAIRLDPALAAAHTALAVALLAQGELREGFAEYEWRSRMADFPSPRRSFSSPPWVPNRERIDANGLTLVLHDEQGVGDALQFVRYAPMLQSRGLRVYIECNSQITRLLSSMPGVSGVISRFQPLPPHDAHASLLSLPHLLGTELDSIPSGPPYLRTEPDLEARWARRLQGYRGLKVGLIWAGNPEFKGDRLRSPGLKAYLPLMSVANVSFFGLQKGAGRSDLELAGPLPSSFTDLGPEIDDFADTAAIMANLDLIISSCTGPVHLAGALGRPVWTILPFAPDWRWLAQGDSTPWYPTMRLFRQDRRGDWTRTIARVTETLAVQASKADGYTAGSPIASGQIASGRIDWKQVFGLPR